MDLHDLDIFLKIVVFLLAISVHESAHAWTAGRYGDPTATMLGRVSLNPIRHIDPIGTILMPLVGILSGFGAFGWAKPTPVDPRNFKEPVKADILTSVAGPASNFLLVALAFVIAAALLAVSPAARGDLSPAIAQAFSTQAVGTVGQFSGLFPVMLLLVETIFINVLLGIFNLVPLPPLDGSHVIRHFMSDATRRMYDTVGMIALFAFVFWGGRVLWVLIEPVLNILFHGLSRIHG